MTVTLPDRERVFVAAGIVRWVRGDDYGVETLVADNAVFKQVVRFVKQQLGNEGVLRSRYSSNGQFGSTAPRRAPCYPLDPPDTA